MRDRQVMAFRLRISALAAIVAASAWAQQGASLDNGIATLSFDASGAVVICEKATGRETVHRSPFLTLEADGLLAPSAVIPAEGGEVLVFRFGSRGDVRIAVKSGCGAWHFTCEGLTIPDVRRIVVGPLEADCRDYQGGMANLFSDEKSGVALRTPGYEDAMYLTDKGPAVAVSGERVASAWSFGLVVSPRSELIPSLKVLTEISGAPKSLAGGAWALESPLANESYVFADLVGGTEDRWVDFAVRSGVSIIHYHRWWRTVGHYDVREDRFPGGVESFRASMRRLHDAGLHTGIHTYTGGIQIPDDPWISGAYARDFLAERSYTLAADLDDANPLEIRVEESPAAEQDAVLTRSSNGNVLRIGDELVQYTGIRRSKPYAFTGLVRGWAGSRVSSHRAGEKVDWMRQRYKSLYPRVDSPLMNELASAVSAARAAANADMFYFDGSEGCGKQMDIDGTRHKIFRALKANPLVEASCMGTANWWFHSRLGALDYPVWGIKPFVDNHAHLVRTVRERELLRGQMGWWAPRTGDETARGHFWDEMEYFASRAAAVDAPVSLQGVNMSNGEPSFAVWRQLTILGWYDRIRRAEAYTPNARKLLETPGWECRLRQDEQTGEWLLSPMKSRTFKSIGVPGAVLSWNFTSPGGAGLGLRVESLYTVDESRSDEWTCLADKPLSGALTFEAPGFLTMNRNGALVLRVRADGGNQVLHLCVKSPPAYGGAVSDHFINLDFTGERNVIVPLRERDYAGSSKYVHSAAELDFRHIGSVSVDIKGEGACVTGLWAAPLATTRLESVQVAVNGNPIPIPFGLDSGDYAELEGTTWTRYSERGDILSVAECRTAVPRWQKGTNVVSLASSSVLPGRAEVTAFALAARGYPALEKKLSPDARKILACEAMEPFLFAPGRGARSAPAVKVRPGERAWLSFEFSGVCDRPEIRIGKQTVQFDVRIRKGEVLTCRDGVNWRLLDASCKELASGRLPGRVERLSGIVPIEVFGNETTQLNVRLVKHYEQ